MGDWNTVTILRKRPPKPSTMKSEQVIKYIWYYLFNYTYYYYFRPSIKLDERVQ